jgi:hypothetical protein
MVNTSQPACTLHVQLIHGTGHSDRTRSNPFNLHLHLPLLDPTTTS